MYMNIYIYVTIIKLKDTRYLRENKGQYIGKSWREKKRGGNDVIIFSFQF